MVMKKYNIQNMIGKNNMEQKTLDTYKKLNTVYLSTINKLTTILTKSVKRVLTVHKLEEFGVPEAMWVIEVERFPAVVTMDSHGRSIHDEVLAASRKEYQRLVFGS